MEKETFFFFCCLPVYTTGKCISFLGLCNELPQTG